MKMPLTWTVGLSASKDVSPERMVSASVPGNAGLDWALAAGLPDWNFGTNFLEYRFMEDCFWLYEARIPLVELGEDERLYFVACGIDYEYVVLLDGVKLGRHEGMFSRREFLLDEAGGKLLQIWISPPPKDPLAEKDSRAEAAQSVKPAVSYGWDWHPRLIPSGIWEEAYLEKRPADYIKDIQLSYTLNDDFSEACLDLKADIAGSGVLSLTLNGPDGKAVLTMAADETATLKNPRLWWCAGYGEPALYRWEAILSLAGQEKDRKSGQIGFRHLRLSMNEGVWEEAASFPLGRSPVPITVVLNGIPIFAKGSNWVNPEIFTGTINRATYEPLLELAAKANFNLLRCWGGAIVNKDDFFDLCDELGLLVWQEFPLSCNNYRGTPAYLLVLEQEARAIIERLKNRTSLAIWCGGNELFNSWSRMTDQSAALRLLNKLCYELDPGRPFLATSPLCGMAHGNYLFRYQDGREVYEVMPAARHTAYTEFGVPSISNLSCCLMAANEADIFPLKENAVTIAHHAFGAWENDDGTWACLSALNDYFGAADSLTELIELSQWLQGEGYKCIFEEARRQKPYCSMALNWCFNEAWPTLAGNAIVNYPASPKASFADVRDACRPALISARIPKFVWHGGEYFSVGLWLLNDGQEEIAPGSAAVTLRLDGQAYAIMKWDYVAAKPNTNIEGPEVGLALPCLSAGKPREMVLEFEAGVMSSTYRLLYK
ncbi:MAG: hypothetical protein FWG91_11580 [Lachnospiraceae bacterium]|nr:hypothetical protein [Lachnospiraceae bacterium]